MEKSHNQSSEAGRHTGSQQLVGESAFYQALASTQRRRLLYYLLESEESTVQELATVLSGWEATDTARVQSDEDVRKVRNSLIHHHLPVLEEAELIAYDSEAETVTLALLEPLVRDIIRVSFEAGQLEEL